MNHPEAAAALKEAELQQHLTRDREDLADDERGPAELAEWARIVQMLATACGTYDPDADAFVQDELAADATRACPAAGRRAPPPGGGSRSRPPRRPRPQRPLVRNCHAPSCGAYGT